MERIVNLNNQIQQNNTTSKETLTIKDKKGNQYEVKIYNNSYIKASDLEKVGTKDEGVLRSYDPGYMNTINCTSKICYIDGDNGILEYRGYPIEQLAEKSTFLEVAFLLIYGELPTASQYQFWKQKIQKHSFVHQDVNGMMKSFRYDAHPMGMLVSTIAATSTFHPNANPALAGQNIYDDPKTRISKSIDQLEA
ncbi:hypothetical protein IMG5_187650 [Ichthyophthirius multifiliis]|uniref:Citrate (Si)-synthase n=1 Tax=Ichthyophthirius multifiliis TaxID=5932 RepID=G0R3V3_ICHMU|nr:hypothetical protein IMG5_187650 [Ichthyophthirius multifiliis]EGR27860.1 hypothetical protein IMG5_187650 [Ichthyophthirius multifiliis]|eukprot:XP_004027205.1 hypothetical protein IMG5_187650 [Ichthyophthirius multifiliis]